jgi:uncharacterized protein involved in exopolysaccharide biosynthesis
MSSGPDTPLLTGPERRTLTLDYGDASFAREPRMLPSISLRDILRPIGRRIWPAATIVVVALLGTFIYLLLISPTYLAVSKVLVHVGREKLSPLTMSGAPANNFVFSERPENINDEIEILQSPPVMDRSFPILQAKLEELAALAGQEPPPHTVFEWAKYAFRTARRTVTDAATWLLDTVKAPLYAIGFSQRVAPEVALHEQLTNAIGVTAVKETNVFAVSFGWSNPYFAAFALNTIMDAYQQEHVRVQANLTGAVDFYHEQQVRAEAELARTTSDLEAYAKASGASDPVAEKQIQLTLIGQLERQLAEDEVNAQQTRDRIAAVHDSKDISGWPATPGVPQETQTALVDLDSRYAQLVATRNKLLAQFRADSPVVADVDAQIARLRPQKQQALLGYLADRLRIQEQAEASMRTGLTAAHGELNRLREIENGYLALQGKRDQLLNQLKEYQTLTGQLEVQRALNARDVSSVSVLSRAEPPALPTWPRKSLIMGLAALFAVLLAAGYVIVMEFFDRTVSTERDLEAVMGVPVIARVPRS